jgi:hypothetical protein
VPLPAAVVDALELLPSRGTSEYVFPSRPTARCPEPVRPYPWDYGKEFRSLAKAARVKDVRITTCGTRVQRF